MPAEDEAHDAYAAIAEWYDIEHDPITADIECWQALLARVAAGSAAVLEIGSGTGRILAGLALQGHHVTGVEPSAAMRARCSRRLAGLPPHVARRVRVMAGSAVALGGVSGPFDAVLFGLNTFAHLTTPAEQQAALDAARSRLRRDGLLILDLDLFGPRRMAETAGQMWWHGTWPIPGGHRLLTHMSVAHPTRERATVALTHLYETHAQGGAVARTTTTMRLALLALGDVQHAIVRAGLSLDALYGSYQLSAWDEAAPHAIIVGRRRDESLAPPDVAHSP